MFLLLFLRQESFVYCLLWEVSSGFPGKFDALQMHLHVIFTHSFTFLYGPKKHLENLFSKERVVFTTTYLASLIATLYCALAVSCLAFLLQETECYSILAQNNALNNRRCLDSSPSPGMVHLQLFPGRNHRDVDVF